MKTFGFCLLVLVSLTLASTVRTGDVKADTNQAAFGLNCGLGLTGQLVPLVLRDDTGHVIPPNAYNFRLVCIQNDKCYARWAAVRSNCNHAFILNMLAECNRVPTAALHRQCDYVALKYHDAVVRKGAAAYTQAQTAAVVAGFQGNYTGIGSLIISGGPNGTVTSPWRAALGKPLVSVAAAGDGLFLSRDGPTFDGGAALGELAISSHPPVVVTASAVDNGFPGYLPPGYVGGVVKVSLTFSWHGGPLPASVKGTFSGSSLVDDANQEPVTFSGSFTATKPINR